MSKPPAHLGLHHVAIFVDDMDASCHFWVQLLGFAIEWQPDGDNIYLTSGTDNLALHRADPNQAASSVRGQPRSLDHLGVIVGCAEDVHSWQSFLQDAGVPIVAAAKLHRDGATSCYVKAPSGVVVQILHHPPISPGLAQLASKPAQGKLAPQR